MLSEPPLGKEDFMCAGQGPTPAPQHKQEVCPGSPPTETVRLLTRLSTQILTDESFLTTGTNAAAQSDTDRLIIPASSNSFKTQSTADFTLGCMRRGGGSKRPGSRNELYILHGYCTFRHTTWNRSDVTTTTQKNELPYNLEVWPRYVTCIREYYVCSTMLSYFFFPPSHDCLKH